MIKKTLAHITIILLAFGFLNINTTNAELNTGEQYFIVTAYYSPLPNQKKYIMGNYEAEKRMNGEGIRGASGKKVFSGMLAAPSSYKFGTKIQLEGIGVGSVEDRGGAIVKAGERNFKHDRIDLWVGWGEEGLQRAMYWGKRTVKGKIINRSSSTSVKLTNHPAPKWATSYLKKNINYSYLPDAPAIFGYGIGTKSTKENVATLQKFLKKLSIYSGKIDGVYNSEIINKLYSFQKDNNLVKNWADIHAGYWSHSTRQLLLKKYRAGEFSIEKKQVEVTLNTGTIEEEKIAASGIIEEKIIESNKITIEENIFKQKLQNSEDIKTLQNILTQLELYSGQENGEYSSIRDVILQFQLDNSVIKNKEEIGAGYFGPKTRKTLEKKYRDFLKEQEIKALEKKRLEEENKKLEEEKKAIQLELDKNSAVAHKKATKIIEDLGNIKQGDVSHEVRAFQKILKQLGYFEYKDTAIFGKKTKASLANYQMKKNLIDSLESRFAGILGPKTKLSLITDLSILK